MTKGHKKHKRSATCDKVLETKNDSKEPIRPWMSLLKENFLHKLHSHATSKNASASRDIHDNKMLNDEPCKPDIGTKFVAIAKFLAQKPDDLSHSVGEEIELIGYSDQGTPLGQIKKRNSHNVGFFSFDNVVSIENGEFPFGFSNNKTWNEKAKKDSPSLRMAMADLQAMNSNKTKCIRVKFNHPNEQSGAKKSVYTLIDKNFQQKPKANSSLSPNTSTSTNYGTMGYSDSCSRASENKGSVTEPTTSDVLDSCENTSYIHPDPNSSIIQIFKREGDTVSLIATGDELSRLETEQLSKEIFASFYVERRTTFEKITLHVDLATFYKIT